MMRSTSKEPRCFLQFCLLLQTMQTGDEWEKVTETADQLYILFTPHPISGRDVVPEENSHRYKTGFTDNGDACQTFRPHETFPHSCYYKWAWWSTQLTEWEIVRLTALNKVTELCYITFFFLLIWQLLQAHKYLLSSTHKNGCFFHNMSSLNWQKRCPQSVVNIKEYSLLIFWVYSFILQGSSLKLSYIKLDFCPLLLFQ